jgi:hypothetical protein
LWFGLAGDIAIQAVLDLLAGT